MHAECIPAPCRHTAAWYGHGRAMLLLLAYGARLDARLRNGCQPLHIAAARGHWDVCKVLLAAAGAAGREAELLAAKNEAGKTPLDMAHPDVAGQLREAAAAASGTLLVQLATAPAAHGVAWRRRRVMLSGLCGALLLRPACPCCLPSETHIQPECSPAVAY